MPLSRLTLPPFDNVSDSAGTAILPKVPQGYVYDSIVLVLGGTFVAADITKIEVILGGTTVWDISGPALDALNKYYSLNNSTTHIPLHFSDRQAKTIRGRRLGAIDTITHKYSDFQIKVTTDGTQSSATLSAYAKIGGLKQPGTEKMLRAIVKSQFPVQGASELPVTVATGSNDSNLVRCIAFQHSNITHLEVKKDSQLLMEKASVADIQFYQEEILRTAQSGYLMYDPIEDGDQSDALDMLRPDGFPAAMSFKATFSGAETITTYADLYATVESL